MIVSLDEIGTCRKIRGKYMRVCRECEGKMIHRSVCCDGESYDKCRTLINYWADIRRRFGVYVLDLWYIIEEENDG